MTIKRTGKHHVSALNNLHNNHLYLGKENDIDLSRKFTRQFICEYELQMYPFDSQVCSMVMVIKVMR